MRISTLPVLCLLLAAASAQAAEGRRWSDTIRHTSSGIEHGGQTIGVGVADTQSFAPGESATALFAIGSDWIQSYLGFYQTKGALTFSAGGNFKFTVAGSRHVGFHVGPGFFLGSVAGDFAYSIYGAAGGHYTLFDHLFFSVDAGPGITHTKDNTNFVLRGLGPVLGLTIAYLF
jgi:hypothetical protein